MLFGLLLEVKREIGIQKNSRSRILLTLIYSRQYDPFMIHEDAEILLFL